MTTETATALSEVLLPLGFKDTGPEHANHNLLMLEMELPGRLGILLAWGRTWSGVYLQWSQGYDETLTILESEDGEKLSSAVKNFLAFIKTL